MHPDESLYPPDWIDIADKDLWRSELLLKAGDPIGAGTYLQQSIEKYFKAYLLSMGWKLKRTHDLQILLNESLKYDNSLEPFRSLCVKVTGFYFFDRYPIFGGTGLNEEDIRDCLDESRILIEKLKEGTIV